MNYIFYFLIIFSIVFGIINGRTQEVVSSIMDGAELSVKIAISLIGIMAFWLGIMRIAEKAGLVQFIAKVIKPITKWLFNEIPEESPVIGNIALSFSANALGLTNAATPIGLRVMQQLQGVNEGVNGEVNEGVNEGVKGINDGSDIVKFDKDTATDSMCMFLAMNTAGFQIIPATVIAILVAVGSKNPTEIIVPTMIVTSIAFISAIFLAKLFQKIWRKKNCVSGKGVNDD